jgi:hypothetical protein
LGLVQSTLFTGKDALFDDRDDSSVEEGLIGLDPGLQK